MRKKLIILTILLAALAAGAYLYFQGREYTFRFTEAELHDKLAERLPLQETYLFIFQVVLDNPRLLLVNGSDRVNAGLDVTLNIHINDEPLPLGGQLDVSGGVRYEAAEGQFFLTEPEIDRLSVQGIPAAFTDRVDSVLTRALAAYYVDRPIYTLRESDVGQAAAKLLLKNVIVENKELVVTLGL